MENFKALHIDVLVDMLAQHTADYTRLRVEGGAAGEFASCGAKIIRLQSEIFDRKSSKRKKTAVVQTRPVNSK